MSALGVLQWRPHLEPTWCALLVVVAALWLVLVWRRLNRRLPGGKARLLLSLRTGVLLLVLVAILDPVSALQKKESSKGKLLVLLDTSSSMDVQDDPRGSRLARARRIVADWKSALPAGVTIDELEFDTQIHSLATEGQTTGLRGTDLGGCLLALAERPDVSAYQAVVLLTDGGDESVENPALPFAPLSVVGIGADPSTWNDVSIADVQFPRTVEKGVKYEINVDLKGYARAHESFAQQLSQVKVRLEHQASNRWERVALETVNLRDRHARVSFSLSNPETGLQRYRVLAEPLAGELSPLNNARVIAVDVQRKAWHILYFTRDLGQSFKTLRNELGRDPGISFTALYRTSGERFTIQGDRLPGDADLEARLPANRQKLQAYDVIIIGSCPAADCTAEQIAALVEFVDNGGVVVFLGGENSFGRGGYAQTRLAALFPWNVSEREPEPSHGTFSVTVPPAAVGQPLVAGLEELLVKGSATVESLNSVADLKPGATALLVAHLGARSVPMVAVQSFGKGRVLGVASDTFWKWATKGEPLRSAYGTFWRQAMRNLTGQLEGGQNLSVRWDRDYYRPGEQATATIRFYRREKLELLRFSATLASRSQNIPIAVEPTQGQTNEFVMNLRFRERGEYTMRLVAYQSDRVLEGYEKTFAVAPLASEGSRLELDEAFLKKLAERGGGTFLRENEATSFVKRAALAMSQKTVVLESSLVEAGPWFFLSVFVLLVLEWICRRQMNLI